MLRKKYGLNHSSSYTRFYINLFAYYIFKSKLLLYAKLMMVKCQMYIKKFFFLIVDIIKCLQISNLILKLLNIKQKIHSKQKKIYSFKMYKYKEQC